MATWLERTMRIQSAFSAPSNQRILVLACSATKRADAGLLPAIERYDGSAFRVLRRFRERGGAMPKVWIFSAKFGLIPGDKPIPDYDQRMNAQMKGAWIWQGGPWRLTWRELLLAHDTGSDLFVTAGKDYRDVLTSWRDSCPSVVKEYPHAIGGVGEQLGQLKRWLEGSGQALPASTGTQFDLCLEAA